MVEEAVCRGALSFGAALAPCYHRPWALVLGKVRNTAKTLVSNLSSSRLLSKIATLAVVEASVSSDTPTQTTPRKPSLR